MNNYTIDFIYNIKNKISFELNDSISTLLNEIEYEIDKNNSLFFDDKNKFNK